MKKPAILLTALLMTLTACSEKGKEPPEETDVLTETEIMTSAETRLVITETMPAETAETGVIKIIEESKAAEKTVIAETEITPIHSETETEMIIAIPVQNKRFTLTVTDRTEAYIIGTLNENTFFADKGEAILVNVPEGTQIEVSSIIEIELDESAEITDALLETPEGERETGSLQISGSYTLQLISPPPVSEDEASDEPEETRQTAAETESSAELETAVTERFADISFKVHMTGAYEGELLEDTFFGQTGDRFYIRIGDSYIVMSTPDTNAVITLWNDAYIGITDSLIIDGSDIYSIMPAD
ncbi:MAG: hypothetical protein MSJ26_04475 [Oscillospiraceae bacterium]|nr:hypothetical protein [Oscillospiraceae bacterium]